MAVKKNNPHVVKMLKLAGSIATDSNEPFFGMVESLAFAVADKAITEQKEFKDLIQSLRTHKGVPTLAENRLSETWSIGELGAYACVKPLFKNIRALPSLPSMTGIYDIACAIRNRGSFAEKGDNAANKLDWSKTENAAPTTAQLAKAMRDANVARNKGKVQKVQTFKEEIEGMIKRLDRLSAGYKVKRNGKDVAVPANKSPHLVDAAASLRKLIAGNVTNLTKPNGRANGRKAA